MKLVSPEELRFGHKGLLANLQAALIMRLARLHGINRLYSDSLTRATAVTAEPTNEPAGNRDSKIPGNAFAAAALDVLRIRYEADPGERQHIPAGGGAILIANQPTGALDGILLIDLLTRIRPDIKFMGNFLLDRIEPLKHYFINVDPFDRKQRNNTGGMRQALAHLQNGGLLVIFPAGEVSTWQHGLHGCKDKPWPPSILRFIRKAAVPVIPLYIHARNSRLFHLAGKIHPLLRTALLPNELLNKHDRTIRLRIGSPIVSHKTDELSPEAYGRFLRANVEYMKPLYHRPRRATRRAARRPAEAVAPGIDRALLRDDLQAIRDTDLLFCYGEYEVYFASPEHIPHLMHEIGRLREITFREIGEGTKNDIDTDRYDRYYRQLFIWDDAAGQLVGAYRLGLGDQIMEQYGIKGFYTYSLFRMTADMELILRQTIELGRSFIVNEYQRKPVSLMLLWKGILNVLLRHDEFRYLMGPVTISGEFQNSSKLLIAAYLRNRHLDRENARHIHPRTGIAVPARIDGTLIEGIDSIELINKIVCDIEQNRFTIPILIRKYLQVGARVLGFNTDHAFCDGLDALILVDLAQVPEKTILMLSKEMTDIDVIGRFSRYRPTIPESSPPAEPTIPA